MDMKSEETDHQEEKFQKIIHRDKPPYYHFLGIDILDVKLGFAKLRMNYDSKLTNPYGFVNGGFFSVLADAALACALLGMTEESPTRRLFTIEYKMNIIKPLKEGSVIAEAKVIHLGRDIAVGDVDLRDHSNKMVAKALITYAVRA